MCQTEHTYCKQCKQCDKLHWFLKDEINDQHFSVKRYKRDIQTPREVLFVIGLSLQHIKEKSAQDFMFYDYYYFLLCLPAK